MTRKGHFKRKYLLTRQFEDPEYLSKKIFICVLSAGDEIKIFNRLDWSNDMFTRFGCYCLLCQYLIRKCTYLYWRRVLVRSLRRGKSYTMYTRKNRKILNLIKENVFKSVFIWKMKVYLRWKRTTLSTICSRLIEDKRSVELYQLEVGGHIRYDKKGASNSTEYGIVITSKNITREWEYK